LMSAHPFERVVRIVYAYRDVMCHGKEIGWEPHAPITGNDRVACSVAPPTQFPTGCPQSSISSVLN
ncbi:MAG TPA: hypothetical protein VHM24_04655, partial [Gemmatimonadaceae bacterium]|nr:hypothetical protein [Gemmatimonadaceae bacterium]